MKIREIIATGLMAAALLGGKEAIAQSTNSSSSNIKSRTEAALNAGDEFSTGTAWQYLEGPSAKFGIRDTFSYPAEGDETHAVDVGLESMVSDQLSIKLVHNIDTNGAEYSPKEKFGINIDATGWLDVGFNTGSSSTERFILPYMMLKLEGDPKIKGSLFAGYSEFDNGTVSLSRLNAWGVLDFNGFAVGAGTVGLDNQDRYIVSLRAEDLLGYGIQTQGFFDKEGLYKYVFFSTRDKYPTSKLAGFLMPIFTGADGKNSIINEQNLLGIDIPVLYECMSDANDTGVWYVWERDNYWFAEADYMLPEPLTSENAKPILFARYTRNTPLNLPESTSVKLGGSLIVPVHYGGVQMTVSYEDNLDDDSEPTTGVQILMSGKI